MEKPPVYSLVPVHPPDVLLGLFPVERRLLLVSKMREDIYHQSAQPVQACTLNMVVNAMLPCMSKLVENISRVQSTPCKDLELLALLILECDALCECSLLTPADPPRLFKLKSPR